MSIPNRVIQQKLYFGDVLAPGLGGRSVKSNLLPEEIIKLENGGYPPTDILKKAIDERAHIIVKPNTSPEANYYIKGYSHKMSYKEIKNKVKQSVGTGLRQNTKLWLLKYK